MTKENTPQISVVTGTYNRLTHLKLLVNSIRNTIPAPIRVQHIIVDNGSKDGTEKWVKSQKDLTFIQLGEPKGAIFAFTHGAHLAEAPFVLLATDDITFPVNSIMRAYQFLDSTPQCGAVTFAHNKNRNEYQADTHPVRSESGTQHHYPYPQISLVRRWLGDECDWWGANTGMKGAFTYGGDNWLGAGIIERGYTVNVVPGAVNDEAYLEDGPRSMNRARHKSDAAIYYGNFPEWPTRKSAPTIPQQDGESLRVLFIAHWLNKAAKREKRALVSAWERVATVWEHDYYSYRDDIPAAGEALQTAMNVFKPHLVFSQIHNQNIITPRMVQQARLASPETVWVNWCGDYWPDKVYHPNIELWKQFDALLPVNMDMLEEMAPYVKTFPYLNTFEEPREEDLPEVEEYDIVFLGNAYSQARHDLWSMLDKLRRKYKIGLFGKVYGGFAPIKSDGVNHYNYAEGRAIYSKAKLAISTNEFTAAGYTSNRFFEVLASGGAMCLHEQTKEFGKYVGVRNGTHYQQWNDLNHLEHLLDFWLQPAQESERKRVAKLGHKNVHTKHNGDARVAYVLGSIVPKLLKQNGG